MYLVNILGSLFVLFGPAYSHIISFSQCPNPQPFENFDLEKFLGNWYMIQVTNGINECMAMEFQKQGDNITVAKRREFTFLRSFNIKHKHKYLGNLKVKDATNPADMTVKWTASFLGEASFKVLDTDYDNYALLFECKQIFFLSSRTFVILSRDRTLGEDRIATLRAKIDVVGGDSKNMKSVNQTDCIPDDTTTTQLDFDFQDGTNELEALLMQPEITQIPNKEELIQSLKANLKKYSN